MADYIDRKKVIEALKELLDVGAYDDDILFVIRNIPFVDTIEVVKCKDCMHCEERQMANGNKFNYCKKVKSSVLEHFYCVWGEKE